LGPPPPAASTLGSGSEPAEERRAIEPAATKTRRTSVKRMRANELFAKRQTVAKSEK
jgi:hypothetical protein